MKKLILLIVPILIVGNLYAQDLQLSKSEKKMISKLMNSTVKSLSKSVKGLSDAQMNFKASPEKWSIKECVYHLALSEDNLWGWMNGVLAAPANPELREKIKVTDEQLMAGVESRANKVKTGEPFEPKNAKWNSLADALSYLKDKRAEHAKFMKSTSIDMRSHVAAQGPAGPMDAYQIVLLLAQHTKRHQAQIEEVKMEAGYPM